MSTLAHPLRSMLLLLAFAIVALGPAGEATSKPRASSQGQIRECGGGAPPDFDDQNCGGPPGNASSEGACGENEFCCNEAWPPRCAKKASELATCGESNVCQMPIVQKCSRNEDGVCFDSSPPGLPAEGDYCCKSPKGFGKNVVNMTIFTACKDPHKDLCQVEAKRPPPPGEGSKPRTIQLVNRCEVPIWIGSTGGNAGSCTTAGDCGPGRACDAKGVCFWDVGTPTDNSANQATDPWKLAASGGSARVGIPAAERIITGDDGSTTSIQWSGNVFARTGCRTDAQGNFVCETGDCRSRGPNDHGCEVGVGGKPPATQAEFTLQNDAKDFYNLEIIDGMNVPIQMTPVESGSYLPPPSGPGGTFWCGSSGGWTRWTRPWRPAAGSLHRPRRSTCW